MPSLVCILTPTNKTTNPQNLERFLWHVRVEMRQQIPFQQERLSARRTSEAALRFVVGFEVADQLFLEAERALAVGMRTMELAHSRMDFHVMIETLFPNETFLTEIAEIALGGDRRLGRCYFIARLN